LLIDTHCHLNFKDLLPKLEQVLSQAESVGVKKFIVPGADLVSSRKAVELADKHRQIYAAVGVHPHHAVLDTEEVIETLEAIINNPNVVAVGEVGMDLYEYQKTKYGISKITPAIIALQKELFVKQIRLAIEHQKALILHNREAVSIFLEVLGKEWHSKLQNKTVFHCCEANQELLVFAKKNSVYIGVDGDISWSKKKQRFIKEVPLERLVLETDSPYLTPLEGREKQKYPNSPANVTFVRDWVAKVKDIESDEVERVTTKNALSLFGIN
jgi:TatD DNase family protein